MIKTTYLALFLIPVLIIMSVGIGFADDDDFEFPEDIPTLEAMLEEAEAAGDTKLINKLNKRIKHLEWKAEKQEALEIKDAIEAELEAAEDLGDKELILELKAELKNAIQDSIRTKFLKNKNGKMPYGLVKPFKNLDEGGNKLGKIEWFEKKLEYYEGTNNQKRIQQLQKQLKKFREIEEMKKNKGNGADKGNKGNATNNGQGNN